MVTAGIASKQDDENVVIKQSASDEDKWYFFDPDNVILWPPFERSALINAPWCKKRYSISIYGLHEEILDFYNWLRPSTLEKAIRWQVFQRVKAVLQGAWPTAKIDAFGSLYTGLFLPYSDIDVVVGLDFSVNNPLEITSQAIMRSGIAKEVSVLDKAFVPIVKMVDKDTEISFDISFNSADGVNAANFIEEMKRRFPVLEPLTLLMKQFVLDKQLNEVYSGGLSSYGLILMLISFLQLHPFCDYSYRSPYDMNLGLILLNFLQLYGQDFNFTKIAICVRNGGCYISKENILKQMNRPSNSNLCIEDPLQPGNDVGRCSWKYTVLRAEFESALKTLCAILFCPQEYLFLWKERYHGSLLLLILSFPSSCSIYRGWLSGRVLSDGKVEKLPPTIKVQSSPLTQFIQEVGKVAGHKSKDLFRANSPSTVF